MDVDLLRPGTVPISPDTLLWFEFLLNPSLLRKHLEKSTSDPLPTELIIKFLNPNPLPTTPTCLKAETPTVDIEANGIVNGSWKNSQRSVALKILSLKVAAFLNWDLKILESKLPINLQSTILRDLLYFLSEKHADPIYHNEIDFDNLPGYVIFGISHYHRWVIRSYSNSCLSGKLMKTNGQQLANNIPDCKPSEITELESERSIDVLQKIISKNSSVPILIPTFDCFVPLKDEMSEVEHQWDLSRTVSKSEFHCQVLMDISNYFIYREMYSNARESLQVCLKEFQIWKEEQFKNGNYLTNVQYCDVTQDLLTGSCLAVGIKPAHYAPTLTQQFHSSVAGQYIDITRVLDADNVQKQISMLYRDSLELDIASEAASGKLTAHRDGIVQVQATNMVRRALEGSAWHRSKVTPTALHKALVHVLPSASELERKRLKYFTLELLASCDSAFMRELCEQPSIQRLLTDSEIQDVQETDYTDPIPHALMSNEIESSPTVRNKTAEVAATERQILSSYDPQEIKVSIIKLLSINPGIDMGKMCRTWETPIPIGNAIINLPGDVLQYYVFVLMAKSYELDKMKNYGMARTFLRVICDEVSTECGVSNLFAKFEQLVSWELLLIDIHQFHSEWPAKHIDWQSLSHGCISVLHKTDGCLPRIALREHCALTLLNMGQWQQLMSLPSYKHSVPIAELFISLAAACCDINKYNKKVSTDAWDKMLPVFLSGQKRRDALSTVTAALCSVVELNALAVVVSLLAKLHNVLNDQPPLELYAYSTNMWPGTIKNANQYSIKYVSEVLFEVLDHALRLYPYNGPWLKLNGDLHFCNNNFSTALKYYLKAAIAGTDFFSRPITRNVIEDHIFKRMIKCCSQLQCHTQAAVLCQFLDDVDYTTAFKSLAETSCTDSMDSYFDCVWDITILEYLINLYSKRGEHYRKQKVVRIIGLLELNSNNNDEIKREAENIRKAKFLRALSKQYIC